MDEPKRRMREKWRVALVRGRLEDYYPAWVDCDNCQISYPVFAGTWNDPHVAEPMHVWCNGFAIEECPYCFPEDAPPGCVVPQELDPVRQRVGAWNFHHMRDDDDD